MSSSILAVSDRGVFHSWEFTLDGTWVYSWEFLLDGDPKSSSILAVSDRGVFHSWEFLLDGNFFKLQRLHINATTIISHPALQNRGFEVGERRLK